MTQMVQVVDQLPTQRPNHQAGLKIFFLKTILQTQASFNMSSGFTKAFCLI